IPAGAGTDAMANYASLRGPVGLNRVYVPASGTLSREAFLAALKKGRTVASNGPLLYLQVGDASPGDVVQMRRTGTIPYRPLLRTHFPLAHLEVVWNGAVVAALSPDRDRRSADASGEIPVRGSGWPLLRAWNGGPHPPVLGISPLRTP